MEAGLAALKEQEETGDFEAGELDGIIDRAEERIAREGVIPAEEVFAALRRKRAGGA